MAHPGPPCPRLTAPAWRCPKHHVAGPLGRVPLGPLVLGSVGHTGLTGSLGRESLLSSVWTSALPATRPRSELCYPKSGRPPGGEGPGLCHGGSLSPFCFHGPGPTTLLRAGAGHLHGRPWAGPSGHLHGRPSGPPSMSGLSVGYLPLPGTSSTLCPPPAVRPACPGHPLQHEQMGPPTSWTPPTLHGVQFMRLICLIKPFI